MQYVEHEEADARHEATYGRVYLVRAVNGRNPIARYPDVSDPRCDISKGLISLPVK